VMTMNWKPTVVAGTDVKPGESKPGRNNPVSCEPQEEVPNQVHWRTRARRFTPAGFSLPFALRVKLTLLLEPMFLERTRKSSSPPLLEPSFNVKRDTAHNPSSGFLVAPVSRASTRPVA
jgi:hypothetical protein